MPEDLIGHLTIYVHELEGFFAGLTRSQTKRVKANIFVQVEIGTEKHVTEVLPKEKLQSRDAARPNANWDEKLSFKIFNERMSVRVDIYECAPPVPFSSRILHTIVLSSCGIRIRIVALHSVCMMSSQSIVKS